MLHFRAACNYIGIILTVVGETDVDSGSLFHRDFDAGGSKHAACFGSEQHSGFVGVGVVADNSYMYAGGLLFNDAESGLSPQVGSFDGCRRAGSCSVVGRGRILM